MLPWNATRLNAAAMSAQTNTFIASRSTRAPWPIEAELALHNARPSLASNVTVSRPAICEGHFSRHTPSHVFDLAFPDQRQRHVREWRQVRHADRAAARDDWMHSGD